MKLTCTACLNGTHRCRFSVTCACTVCGRARTTAPKAALPPTRTVTARPQAKRKGVVGMGMSETEKDRMCEDVLTLIRKIQTAA